MADMVFAPDASTTSTPSARSCSRRSRWSRTRRRTSSTTSPRRRSSAAHPLGRPVIGTRRGDLARSRGARSPATTGGAYAADERSSSRQPGTSTTTQLARARSTRGGGAAPRGRAARRRASPPRADRHAGPPLPAQGHRAVPRLPRRARDRALRRAALRRVAARRDPRRLGVVAALPGDPREARDGVLRLQLRRRSTPTRARSASTWARARRTSRECLEIAAAELADVARGQRPRRASSSGRRRTSKGRILLSLESTSNRMTPAREVARSPDTELLTLEADRRSASTRSPRRRSRELARRRCSRPSGSRPPGSAPTRSASRDAVARVNPALRRERGRDAGRALRRRGQGRRGARAGARAAGHEVVDGAASGPAGCDAAVDFTRPDAVVGERRPRASPRASRRRRDDGLRPRRGRRAPRGRRASPCFYAPELRARRRPDDALRRGGREASSRAPRSSSSTRDEARRAVGDGEGDRGAHGRRRADPLRPAARASSPTRRSSSAGRGRR